MTAASYIFMLSHSGSCLCPKHTRTRTHTGTHTHAHTLMHTHTHTHTHVRAHTGTIKQKNLMNEPEFPVQFKMAAAEYPTLYSVQHICYH